jgi:hypothetical protein
MEVQRSIEDLRFILKALRMKIEKLEATPQATRGWLSKQRRDGLEKAKVQEVAILAKLAKSGVKL